MFSNVSITFLSLTCPSKSIKNIYCQTFFFVGLDSIFVKFILFLLNSDKILYKVLTLSLMVKIILVLSLPVLLDISCPNTKNLVQLSLLSSIDLTSIFKL